MCRIWFIEEIRHGTVKWARIINGLTGFTPELFLSGKSPERAISGLENRGRAVAYTRQLNRLSRWDAVRKAGGQVLLLLQSCHLVSASVSSSLKQGGYNQPLKVRVGGGCVLGDNVCICFSCPEQGINWSRNNGGDSSCLLSWLT